MRSLLHTTAPRSVVLVRLLVGGVFLAEGVQKFLFPAELGAGPFSLAKLPRYGAFAAIHEARTDLCMWLGSLFLIIVGAGLFSLDALLARRRSPVNQKR